MKGSPKAFGLFYFILATVFVFIAIQLNKETGWSIYTFIAIAFAAMDYMISFKHFLHARQLDKNK